MENAHAEETPAAAETQPEPSPAGCSASAPVFEAIRHYEEIEDEPESERVPLPPELNAFAALADRASEQAQLHAALAREQDELAARRAHAIRLVAHWAAEGKGAHADELMVDQAVSVVDMVWSKIR